MIRHQTSNPVNPGDAPATPHAGCGCGCGAGGTRACACKGGAAGGGCCSGKDAAKDIAAELRAARVDRGNEPALRDFAEFDDPAFEERYVRPVAGSASEVDLFVPGVHCASCLRVVERLPSLVQGVVSSQLDLARKILRVRWRGDIVRLSTIATHLASMGYTPSPAYRSKCEESRKHDDRRQLVRLGVAGFCAGNVMLLSFALYGGMFEGMDDLTAQVMRWLSLALSAICLGWPGAVFLRGAWLAIRARTVTMDVPIALGLVAAFAWSALATISRTAEAGHTASDIYFDSLAMLIFFLLVGRFVQHRQQRRAQDSIELLFSLTPASARVVDVDEGGQERARTRPTSAVKAGQLVDVLPGEVVPVDGVITRGHSQFNTSILTGESLPTSIGEGESVAAGITNVSKPVRVRVTATGVETRVGQLMSLVAEHSRRRAPIVLLADRMALHFLIAMLVLAAATVAIWWHEGPRDAVLRSIALLIVACPCGLGLATPMAMTVALGKAAKEHLLIKGGSVIQSLAHAAQGHGHFCFDKTGTLTQGRLKVMQWSGDQALQPLLAALERQSTHPIATALARDLTPPGPDAIVESSSNIGGGIHGTVRTAGKTHAIAAGTPRFLESVGVVVTLAWQSESLAIASSGLTPVLVARDGAVAGVAGLGDPLRPEAADLIAMLNRRGCAVTILSGDHPDVVRAVAERVGVPAHNAQGHVTPEQKVAFVEAQRHHAPDRPIVMIGDGVNDAAALAAADVGIAVHGGAEASLAAAQIYCGRPGLEPLSRLLDGAARTMRIVRVALGVSLAYNVVAAALAMSGYVTPLLAAILMPVASFSVVAVAMLAWGRSPREDAPGHTPQVPGEMEGVACPSFS
jgi:Cu2+-exporting ATPase